MNPKILFEIKKFEKRNKKINHATTLPTAVLFTDRKKISNLEETIKSLPKNSAIIIREYDLNKNDREIFAEKVKLFSRDKSLKILVERISF